MADDAVPVCAYRHSDGVAGCCCGRRGRPEGSLDPLHGRMHGDSEPAAVAVQMWNSCGARKPCSYWASCSATISFLCLALAESRHHTLFTTLAVAFAALGSLTMPNGLLVWPVLVLQALYLKRSRRATVATLALVGAVAVGYYLRPLHSSVYADGGWRDAASSGRGEPAGGSGDRGNRRLSSRPRRRRVCGGLGFHCHRIYRLPRSCGSMHPSGRVVGGCRHWWRISCFSR